MGSNGAWYSLCIDRFFSGRRWWSADMKLYNEDCIKQMQKMIDEGVQVDSIVTDPPYGIHFMGENWDSFKSTRVTKSQLVTNLGAGMRMTTHEENINFQKWCNKWASLCLELLKPGGYILAFSSARTYHHLACGIESAGFQVRDQIMWLYGSGFPKSLNIGKKIDEMQGWGTALKPAHEPIVMARKPVEGTIAENVLKHGTGGINIDGCRIGTEKVGARKSNSEGRFPANVMHDSLEQEWARYFYCPKVSKNERKRGLHKNIHPTVKPVELMKYLCRLVTPKGGTVLDPFMGSGSTGMATKNEGFEFIGIEKEKEYYEIAEQRINSTSPLLDFL